MKQPPQYIVMGEDGKEYGPVSAGQVRQWVAEGRLDKKTPVKPTGARDWIFLGDLPEFARLFAPPPAPAPKDPPRRGLIIAALVAALAAAAYFGYRYLYNP